MNVKKKPMPIWQIIFYVISFLFLIGAFIYLGTKNYNAPVKKLTDAESFTKEYGIEQKNVFVYKTAKEILETLNSGSALIFMAFPENQWSSYYADFLNELAKKNGIQEIYYYNFLKDRKNNNRYYENIVGSLKAYIPILDDETANLYAPTFLIVKDGAILYYDDETSILKGDHSVREYWTQERKMQKIEEITTYLFTYKGLVE